MQTASIVATIIGTGTYMPKDRVTSAALDMRLGKPDNWLQSQCGVAVRPHAGPDETQEYMAAAAATAAIDAAGINAADIDLILFGAAVGRQPIPATAPLIKGLLGITNARTAAYDINATCLSALVAMDLASLHIRSGRAQTVLVIGAEIASRALPWRRDPATAGLFGDGAGAVVLSAGSGAPTAGLTLKEFAMETWPEGYDHCALAAGGTRYDFASDRQRFEDNAVFNMDGHKLFKLNRKRLPEFIDKLVTASGWRTQDIDVVIPHQASPLALEHMIRRCGFAPEKVINTVRETGNQVAASLPIALHKARSDGRITPGAKVLMVGTSAGVSVAGMTLTG